ncbi:MAG: hypothetical protein ACE1Y4_16470, partial [Lysobacterales bacterium]
FLLVRDGRKLFPKLRISATEIGWLAVSGTLLALNWLLFVWAVVHDRVLATSLGYFITPLVNILLGKLFLQERLSSYQKVAVAIAALGTAYLAWFLGQPPWISLSLAFLFGTYGLLRKRLSVGPLTGLMWENMLLLGPAVAYMLWRNHRGEMDFLHQAPIAAAYLIIVGPFYAFHGLGLSMYFASQGAGTVIWPVVSGALRLLVAAGGGMLAVQAFNIGFDGLLVFVAAGMVVYGVGTALSILLGAWRRVVPIALMNKSIDL